MNRRPATARSRGFHQLMRYRILDILLVATPYESFVLEEAGELSERMLGEFRELEVQYVPGLTGVSSGEEALALAKSQRRFNLIVATPQLGDMNAVELARRVREAELDVPVVVLARDRRELSDLAARHGLEGIERAFLWQGDARVLVAIVKSVEDRRNAPQDCGEMGVQAILLIEDRVRQYSSFLPAMYSELLGHTQRVISEALNLSQKVLRMRARPKVLLCTSWEEAEAAYSAYSEEVLGIVSDVEFPRAGQLSATAGADFARHVRERHPDIPIVLHSSQPDNEALAREIGSRFLLKGSPLMLEELGRALLEDFGFGDFVFRLPTGEEVARAGDLEEFQEGLATVPGDSVLHHASRNHFSRWLKARTAFDIAYALRPQRPEEFPDVEAMRTYLVRAIADYRDDQSRLLVADFDRKLLRDEGGFWRIGGGSLGGKARGLVFVRRMLAEAGLRRRFRNVELGVPTALVLGTDVFDRFLAENDLLRFAVECGDDQTLDERFEAARLPQDVDDDLAAFVEQIDFPLAVRSSSLLEDSQHHPFTGVYDTLMLANDVGSTEDRLQRLGSAIRAVYASTFTTAAKTYLASTGHRLEEEKMAVLVQRIVGSAHGPRFYPSFAGVARSINFYPSGPMRSEDGVAAVALGLGRTVVDGEPCLRFCPRYPRHVPQLDSIGEALSTTQRSFWALPLGGDGGTAMREASFDLEVAESDGVLGRLASTYSAENDALSDGVARAGTRVTTFAPLLKLGEPPLAEILETLLAEGARGMGSEVEIEFAGNLAGSRDETSEFSVLQMRPLVVVAGSEALELGEFEPEAVVAHSRKVLGNGRVQGIRDLVLVDPLRYERAKSVESAAAVARLNAQFIAEGTPYLLIAVGRLGSRDPWLGIPLDWEQVCGARVIVEAGLRDVAVRPSQGSHFFQNLAASGSGYFTIDESAGDRIDWSWLRSLPRRSEEAGVRYLRLDQPISVLVDGRRGEGVILKPGAEPEEQET
jgi:CheY-like chemotaxis protein